MLLETKKSCSKISSGDSSLVWEEYREALLAHPDAIELPLEHLDAGHAYVAERSGQILGFSVVVPRPDGDADLDALLVEPAIWKHGAGCSELSAWLRPADQNGFT